jgi:hypothetical protein
MRPSSSFFSGFGFWCRVLLACVGALAATRSAVAQIGTVGEVIYSPTLEEVQGQIPYGASYPLTIRSPSGLTSNATVSFEVTMNLELPAGTSAALALTYVRITPSTLTFTGPNQEQTVNVSFGVPVGAVAGKYGYQIRAVGWPGISDSKNTGSAINATVSLAPLATPPDVAISSPEDQSTITVTPPSGSLPIDVPVTFTAVSSGIASSVITAVDADLNGTPLTGLTITGLNTFNVTGTATLRIASYGSHTVTARATNIAGTASDVSTFKVVVGIPPPVAAFEVDKPAPSSSYTYVHYAGLDPAVTGVDVPILARGTTTSGGLQNVQVTLADGAELTTTKTGLSAPFTPGSLIATASATRRHSVSGEHTLRVVATDIYGQISAPASVTYKVEVKNPMPDVTNPVVTSGTSGVTSSTTNGVVTFTLPVGVTTMNVNYAFVSTSNSPFKVDTVSAALDGVILTGANAPATTPTTPASPRNSTGTIASLGVGTYSIKATCTSSGASDEATTQFIIKGSNLVPPTVVFNSPTPADRSTLMMTVGSPLSVPISFTGTSNNASTVITAVTAKLNGNNITPLATTTLNQKNVTGTSTLTITSAGTYTIRVTATDIVGVATAERVFYVKAVAPQDICGEVFFDIDRDKTEDADEFGLSGITVRLLSSTGAVVKTSTTNSCGYYIFVDVAPGSYTVSAVAPAGFDITTTAHGVTVSSCDVQAPAIGLGLHFASIRGMTAGGYTIGFWKNNLDKAISGKTNGVQVSKATLTTYTNNIGDFALSVYDNISMKTASSTMGYTGSNAASLLSKQLIASEYNYQNGAYVSGNKTLTFCFVYWGESVLKNSSQYSASYLTWVKDWFDAYNNSHGGAVLGPQ